ncbi:MAG TPA: NADH-quinone oxidoreductase subunit J [Tepidisphaeraceae bacterium]|jgi:NADH-quinone oxidoreductase subunit J|nr:NADH-quinone oxidoreductase subunit J [Tepidisphaeraceae bacterium]
MLSLPSTFSLLAASVLSPVTILILCVVAGVGTVLLLPGKREATIRWIGGVILLAALLIFIALIVREGAGQRGEGVYFWLFSGIAVISAIRVVSHAKPVYSALYFVLTVLAVAGLFVLLWAEFMAAALILIYAGAILVTYVFVIMLASQAHSGASGQAAEGAEYDRVSREPVLATAVGFALMGVLLFVIFEKSEGMVRAGAALAADAVMEGGAVRALGAYLFSDQLLTLELAGVLLTVSMVGAVIIARRYVAEGAGEARPEVIVSPATPLDDDPHSIPVYGTRNPVAKAYPEN